MKVRIISAIIALPVFIIPILVGGPLLYIVVALAIAIGLFEFNRAFNIQSKGVFVLQLIASFLLLFSIEFRLTNLFFGSVIFMLMFLFMYYVIVYPKLELKDVFYGFFGFVYITLMIGHIILVRQIEEYGSFMIWLIFIISFGSDSFAYFVGRTMGKHKLSKDLSPKKTIEGAFGGIFGAALLSVLFAFYGASIGYQFELIHYIGFTLMGALGSIISQFGDISASAMKRVVGIKDFGKIMPGHGGLIDRIDSLLFVAPFVYYALLIILKGF